MNTKRVCMTIIAMLSVTMLIAMGFSAEVAAESKTETTIGQKPVINTLSPEEIGLNANKLLLRISADIDTGQRYNDALENANAEDSLVLQLQRHKLRIKIMSDISELTGTLLELEKSGQQTDLRKEVESIYTRTTPALKFHINRYRDKIDAIRARRAEVKSEERAALEYEVEKYSRRLDEFYTLGRDHITKMQELGMNTEEARKDFIQMLNERNDELTGRIDLALVRIEELDKQNKATPDDAGILSLLKASDRGLKTNVTSLETIIGLMDTFELDTSAPRARLVTLTYNIDSGILDTGVAMSLVRRSTQGALTWLSEKGPGYLIKLIILFGILLAFIFAARVVRVGLEKALSSSNLNLSRLGRRMLVSTSSKLVIVFGILIILSQLGISLGPLLAGLGVIGFIAGFALQDSLSNFAAGVMILLYRPYDVGDFVDVGGVLGTVDKMSLVSTSLLTIDNQLYIVPNSKIWGDVIKNVTAQKLRRVDMVFGISYSDDIEKAEAMLADILKSHDKVLDYPESMIRLHTLGESSVDFIVRPWVKVDDYWDVYWDVTRSVKMRFDDEKISIPFPQRDVHLYHEKSPDEVLT
jgi:small conductance mechanosensitive channel